MRARAPRILVLSVRAVGSSFVIGRGVGGVDLSACAVRSGSGLCCGVSGVDLRACAGSPVLRSDMVGSVPSRVGVVRCGGSHWLRL